MDATEGASTKPRIVLTLVVDGIPGGEATFEAMGPGDEGRTIYALVRAVVGNHAYEIKPSTIDPETGALVPCSAEVRVERKGTCVELFEHGLGAGYAERTELHRGKIVYVRAKGERTIRYTLALPAHIPPLATLPGRPDIPAYPLLIEAHAEAGLAVFMMRRRLCVANA